jgi:hypothetical protein
LRAHVKVSMGGIEDCIQTVPCVCRALVAPESGTYVLGAQNAEHELQTAGTQHSIGWWQRRSERCHHVCPILRLARRSRMKE